jgi:hypothetical protein
VKEMDKARSKKEKKKIHESLRCKACNKLLEHTCEYVFDNNLCQDCSDAVMEDLLLEDLLE